MSPCDMHGFFHTLTVDGYLLFVASCGVLSSSFFLMVRPTLFSLPLSPFLIAIADKRSRCCEEKTSDADEATLG